MVLHRYCRVHKYRSAAIIHAHVRVGVPRTALGLGGGHEVGPRGPVGRLGPTLPFGAETPLPLPLPALGAGELQVDGG